MILNRQFAENNSALDARLDEVAVVLTELLSGAPTTSAGVPPMESEDSRFSACLSAEAE